DNEFEIIKGRRIQSPRTKTRSYRERIKENLNGRKKEEGIINKENDYERLFQEILNIFNTLSREIVQKNEETVGINVTLGPEDLVVNLNKNLPEESLARIEGRDSMLESFWESAEISQGYKRNKIEKDKKSGIERKDRIMVSASKPKKCCSECREGRVKVDECDDKKVAKMKEINSMSYNRDGIEKADEFKTYHGSLQGAANRTVEDDDYFDDDKMMVQEDVEIEDDEKGLTAKKQDHDLTEFRGMIMKKEDKAIVEMDNANCKVFEEFDQRKKKKVEDIHTIPRKIVDGKTLEFLLEIAKEYTYLISNQDYSRRIEKKLQTWQTVMDENKEFNYCIEADGIRTSRTKKVGKCNEIGEKKNGTDEIGVKKGEYEIVDRKLTNFDDERAEEEKQRKCRYQGIMDVKRDEACGWCLGSTKAANSTGKFDPGGQNDGVNCFRNSISPFKNKKTKAVDSGVKYDKNNCIVMGCKMGSEKEDKERKIVNDDRRYHMNDKKMEYLPISDREVIQNIKYAKKGVMVASGVGDISKHMYVIETIENEMNNPLFDPGGSTFLKMKEIVLEAKINSYLNLATYLMQHSQYLCVDA
ncbi:28374_t:CDS:2, partial [Gigaspora margarita]